jgi:hypothetical protein
MLLALNARGRACSIRLSSRKTQGPQVAGLVCTVLFID